MKNLYVINSNGEREPFSLKKIYRACRKSGASRESAENISKEIKKMAYPGIETSEIFRLVKLFLSETSPRLVMRLSLREAMTKLGPAGFDFEKYIGEVFARNGFEVKLNEQLPGFCISSYEIDFLAKKKNVIYIGECKYHRIQGGRVDLKVALANYARFLDILRSEYFHQDARLKTIVVTNSKFTSEVIKYSKCMNIELLGWRYPLKKGLENMIESSKLYPITILPSLKGHFKNIFAQEKIMLASDLLRISPKELSKRLNLPLKEIKNLVEEAGILLE